MQGTEIPLAGASHLQIADPNGPLLTHVADPLQYRNAGPCSYTSVQSMTTHPEAQKSLHSTQCH